MNISGARHQPGSNRQVPQHGGPRTGNLDLAVLDLQEVVRGTQRYVLKHCSAYHRSKLSLTGVSAKMLSHVPARPAGVAIFDSSLPRTLQPSEKLERLLGGISPHGAQRGVGCRARNWLGRGRRALVHSARRQIQLVDISS